MREQQYIIRARKRDCCIDHNVHTWGIPDDLSGAVKQLRGYLDAEPGLDFEDAATLADVDEGIDLSWYRGPGYYRHGSLVAALPLEAGVNYAFGDYETLKITEVDPVANYLSEIGVKGGKAKTDAKAAAARANGTKGGRPKQER